MDIRRRLEEVQVAIEKAENDFLTSLIEGKEVTLDEITELRLEEIKLVAELANQEKGQIEDNEPEGQ